MIVDDYILDMYKKLGLYYEGEIRVTRLTSYVTPRIDFAAVLRNDPKRFRALDIQTVSEKRTLLLCAWNVDWLDTDIRCLLMDFLTKAIEQGFVCHVSCEQGLVQVRDQDSLYQALLVYKPVSASKAKALAAEQRIAADRLALLTANKLQEIFIMLGGVATMQTIPLLPEAIAFDELDALEAVLEPEDTLSVVYDFDAMVPAYWEQSAIASHIREMHMLHCPVASLTLAPFLPCVERLVIRKSNVEMEDLETVLSDYNVKMLILDGVAFGPLDYEVKEHFAKKFPNLERFEYYKTSLPATRSNFVYGSMDIAVNRQQLIWSHCDLSTESLEDGLMAYPDVRDIIIKEVRFQPKALIAPDGSVNKIPQAYNFKHPLIYLPIPFPHARHFTIIARNLANAALHPMEIAALVEIMPNLRHLTLNSLDLTQPSPLLLREDHLHLRSLDWSASIFTAGQLEYMILRAPRLAKIILRQCPLSHLELSGLQEKYRHIHFDLGYRLIRAEPPKSILSRRSDVVYFNPDNGAYSCPVPPHVEIDPDMIQTTLPVVTPPMRRMFDRIGPWLWKFHFFLGLSQLDDTFDAYSARGIQRSIDNVPYRPDALLQLGIASKLPDDLAVTGDFLHDPDVVAEPQLQFANTNPGNYHLGTYIWQNNQFVRFQPSEEDLVDVDVERVDPQVLHQRPREDERKYSHVKPDNINPHQWNMLPASSNSDTLCAIGSLHSIRTKRHREWGYHYVRVEDANDTGPFAWNFEMEPGSTPKPVVNEEARSLLPLISQLRFTATGLLQNNALQAFRRYPVDHVIDALYHFCNFPEESQPDVTAESHELLNHLIQTRAGACRHRAKLFVALASELGIKSLLVRNDIHEFAVALGETGQLRCLNLGGARIGVKPKPVDVDLPSCLQTPVADDSASSSTSLAAASSSSAPVIKKRRVTKRKNEFSLPEHDPALVVQALTRHARTSKTQWVITPDNNSVEALHDAMLCQEETPCFFSLNPDTISLQATRVQAGQPPEWVASELAHFIQAATDQPETPHVWFVHLPYIKRQHIRLLNTLTDSSAPAFDGVPLPDSLRIVLLTHRSLLPLIGEDMVSRMASTSQCPRLPAPAKPDQVLQVPGQDDALVVSPDDWEEELLVQYQMEADGFGVTPGALVRCLQSGGTGITLFNVPWDNEDFRCQYRVWQRGRPFMVNGEWHQLPPGFSLNLAKPVLTLSLDALKKKLVGQVFDYVLNANNWREFVLNPWFVRAEGGIGQGPLMLHEAEGNTICLWVTGDVPHVVWYKLLESDAVKHSALRLYRVGDAVLPEELMDWAEQYETLVPSKTVQALLTNDVDFAETMLRQSHPDIRAYPIDGQTQDVSFLFHIRCEQEVLYGEETDLLKVMTTDVPVILKGRFSPILREQLESLFLPQPYLMVNGERVMIRAQVTLVSDDYKALHLLPAEDLYYDATVDFQHLDPTLHTALSATYQELKLTPCHSHFYGLPEQTVDQYTFVRSLMQRLRLSVGLPARDPSVASSSSWNAPAPTTAWSLMMDLARQRLVVFVSDTGEGKSHLMETELKQLGPGVKVYSGHQQLEWLTSNVENPVIFFDEANTGDYNLGFLESLARGDSVINFEGNDFPLKRHAAVLAVNPDSTYEGRQRLDLLRRFPFYQHFIGQGIEAILAPLHNLFESRGSLPLIAHFYRLARQEGLPLTPRNALMMAASTIAIKSWHNLAGEIGEQIAVYLAIYYGFRSAEFQHKQLGRKLRDDVQVAAGYKPRLFLQDPNTPPERFVWTRQRQKLLAPLLIFLEIRRLKQVGVLPKGIGQNAFLLEGGSGYAKTSLFRETVTALGLELAVVRSDSLLNFRDDTLRAWNNGELVLIDEFNCCLDLSWLLKLLANTHPETGEPPKVAGAAFLLTQNGISLSNREQLCAAMLNRMVTLRPKPMSPVEFRQILLADPALSRVRVDQLVAEYTRAVDDEGPQNPRDWFLKAKERIQPEPSQLEQQALDDWFDSLLSEIVATQWELGRLLFFSTGLGGETVVINGIAVKVPHRTAEIVAIIQDYKTNGVRTLDNARHTFRQVARVAQTALENDSHHRAGETMRFYQGDCQRL